MKVKHCLITLLVLMFAFGPASLLLAASPAWPSLGGNFRRSGQSSLLGPLDAQVLWKFETGGAIVGSITLGSLGHVHVACEDGKLYTLDTAGIAVWVLDVNSPLVSAPSVGPDGSLYVGDKAGKVHAVAADGRLLWSHSTGGAVYSSPAVDDQGRVYVGSGDGTLYALAKEDGAELWRFKTKGPGALPNGAIFASPAIGADGAVYIAGLYDPALYALNPADGSVKWVCRFPDKSIDPNTAGWPFASPVVAPDGTIYQTLLYDPNLYAIEPVNGAIRWSVNLCDPRMFGGSTKAPIGSDGWSEPVIGPDGTIYVALDDSYVRAVSPGGILLWVTKLGSVLNDMYGPNWSEMIGVAPGTTQSEEASGLTLTVDRGGNIYAAAENGRIYVVAPGSLAIAEFPTGGWPAFPVLAADDLLILADSKDYSSLEAGGKNAVWALSKPPAPTRTR